ncbi:MAG: DUF1080 domain-containing protein [Planctomycetes bacterium]|jgi:tetratricopeptide (TPR) repeat protein|nr:DUF1080 domain-containing protein [Planctomycetota bacterium]
MRFHPAIAAALLLAAAGTARAQTAIPKDLFGGKAEPQPDGTVKVTYDFDDPSELRDWDGVAAGAADGAKAWVADGALEVRAEKGESAFARLKAPFAGDLTIEARARVNPPRSRELLFLFHETEEGGGYRCAVAYVEKQKMHSYFLKLTEDQALKKVDKPEIEPGKWTTVRIRVQGKTLALAVENKPILTCTDEEFRSGRVGFGTWGSHVSFDSITVQGRPDEAWVRVREAEKTAGGPVEGLEVPGETALLDALPTGAKEGVLKGKKWFSMREYAQAEAEFAKAAGLAPGKALPWFFAGVARRSLGRADEAEEAFGRALEADAGFAPARLQRARVRRGAGPGSPGLEGATQDLRAAIAADGRSVEAFLELATVLYLQREPERALAAAQKAFRLAEAARGEAPAGEADRLREAAAETERARDAYAWSARGLPLRPARRATLATGELVTDAGEEDAALLGGWAASVSGALALVTGKGVEGVRIAFVADPRIGAAYRFPGAMSGDAGWCGYLNLATGELVVRKTPEREAWLRAAGSLIARAGARARKAPPWIEEALALYFDLAPGAGGERPRLGTPHPRAVATAKKALATGKAPGPAALAAMDRAAFDRSPAHADLAYSLLHYLLHGAGGRPDALRGAFERAAGGGWESAFGGTDWAGLEANWKKHVQGLPE